jgi:shikimate dehydrogenase
MPQPLRYAVFGHPIGHSQSPRIHQLFAAQFGIALGYEAIDAAPEAFADAVRRFFADAGGGHGANVTLPHKGAAFALADERSEAAVRAGSANVLTRLADGRLAAHNTDGAGLVRDLAERHGVDLRDRDMLLLGAGGAARGVAWSLLDAGVASLTIVNATSAGVLRQPLNLPFALAGTRAVCCDLAYGEAAIPFLAWAEAAGAYRTFDGLGMLVETAADAFELWHGHRPDTEPVYRALRQPSD